MAHLALSWARLTRPVWFPASRCPKKLPQRASTYPLVQSALRQVPESSRSIARLHSPPQLISWHLAESGKFWLTGLCLCRSVVHNR